MSTAKGRTQKCGRAEARTRLAHARKFLEAAQLAADEDAPESSSVAASLAVLCGIAAADAACCAALGRRSRSQDHRDAELLVATVEPGGKDAANALRRLIDLKETAHYGLINVSRQKLTAALRQAGTLVEFARATIRR
jgi:hypothetical protein